MIHGCVATQPLARGLLESHPARLNRRHTRLRTQVEQPVAMPREPRAVENLGQDIRGILLGTPRVASHRRRVEHESRRNHDLITQCLGVEEPIDAEDRYPLHLGVTV